MNFYSYHEEGKFEPVKWNEEKKKSKKRKNILKRVKKFFNKFSEKVVNVVLSTASQIAILFFDRKFKKAFA